MGKSTLENTEGIYDEQQCRIWNINQYDQQFTEYEFFEEVELMLKELKKK